MQDDTHGHEHSTATPYHSHDYGFDPFNFHGHYHDDDEIPTPEELEALGEAIWKIDNVELTTVGVDVGSSTSHLMFAKVLLHRRKDSFSTRFVVVAREILSTSPILLTPYRADNTIDSDTLQQFVRKTYEDSGVQRDDVDSGAVILTGEALKRTNARAIADLFATETGKFVCASAGHHLEAHLSAHGSGAVVLSRKLRQNVLNVDIGGGTSKFALVHDGQVLHSAAVAIGGRLVAFGENGEVVRIEEPARQIADAVGVEIKLGEPLSAEARTKLVDAMVDVLVQLIRQESPSELALALHVTDPIVYDVPPEAISFSGGVSEYIYGTETQEFGDLAPQLAAGVRAALSDGRIPLQLHEPAQRIRATVIGASQFTVQVSGNTIFISDEGVLPLHNLPVLQVPLKPDADIDPAQVTDTIKWAMRRFDLHDGESSIALGIRWHGDPWYRQLRALADGIAGALPRTIENKKPLVLAFDGDVGNTLGHILKQELRVPGDVVSIDGMHLHEFDYIDIGQVIQPANVVPVVIKSLLFAPTGHSHHGGEILEEPAGNGHGHHGHGAHREHSSSGA